MFGSEAGGGYHRGWRRRAGSAPRAARRDAADAADPAVDPAVDPVVDPVVNPVVDPPGVQPEIPVADCPRLC